MNVLKYKGPLLVLFLSLALGACVESERPQASGKGTIRALNASVSAPGVAYLLEERVLGSAVYKVGTTQSQFDNFDYTVNFEHHFQGDVATTRLVSVPFTLTADNDHLFIFTGSLSQPDAMMWQRPNRDWDGSETVMEVTIGHLSPQTGDVDIYFDAPGVAPVLGEARASLVNGERSGVFEVEGGEYEVIITEKDDPTTVLYASTTIAYAPANNYLVALFDPDPGITSPISVNVLQAGGSTLPLPDQNSPPQMRLFHVAFGTVDIDLYRNDDFTQPVIAGATFGTPTPFVPVDADEQTATFTEADNVGAILYEMEFSVLSDRLTTRFYSGDPATPSSFALLDDFRQRDDLARLRFALASSNHTTVDIYLVENGTDINDVGPRFFSQIYQSNTGYIDVIDNSYQVYATIAGTKTIVAGPYDFDVISGDIVQFVLVDTVDPAVDEWIKYDHITSAPP